MHIQIITRENCIFVFDYVIVGMRTSIVKIRRLSLAAGEGTSHVSGRIWVPAKSNKEQEAYIGSSHPGV